MAVVKAVHGHEGEVTGLVQRTHARVRQGQHDATLLLGIDGLAVASVRLEDGGGRVVDVVTDEETAAACPECGVLSTSRKGSAVTRPRDVPYGTAPIQLVWHKTRWRCREQGCPRGSFTECLPSVPARSRLGHADHVGSGSVARSGDGRLAFETQGKARADGWRRVRRPI